MLACLSVRGKVKETRVLPVWVHQERRVLASMGVFCYEIRVVVIVGWQSEQAAQRGRKKKSVASVGECVTCHAWHSPIFYFDYAYKKYG